MISCQMIIAEIMKVVIMTCINMAGRCKRLCPLSGRKVRIPVSVAGVLSTEPCGDLYAWCCLLSGMRGSMHGAVYRRSLLREQFPKEALSSSLNNRLIGCYPSLSAFMMSGSCASTKSLSSWQVPAL